MVVADYELKKAKLRKLRLAGATSGDNLAQKGDTVIAQMVLQVVFRVIS